MLYCDTLLWFLHSTLTVAAAVVHPEVVESCNDAKTTTVMYRHTQTHRHTLNKLKTDIGLVVVFLSNSLISLSFVVPNFLPVCVHVTYTHRKKVWDSKRQIYEAVAKRNTQLGLCLFSVCLCQLQQHSNISS